MVDWGTFAVMACCATAGLGMAAPAAVTLSRSPCAVPPSYVIPYMHFDVQFLEKFGVTFRREGETVTLKCTLLVTPELKRVQPRAEWYRDGECDVGTTPRPGTPLGVRVPDVVAADSTASRETGESRETATDPDLHPGV